MAERTKQPREVVDFTVDMRDWHREIPAPHSDFIEDVEIEIDIQGDPDDLVSGPGTQPVWQPVGSPPREAKCWFGGGRDGIEYKITALVTTDEGRVEEYQWRLLVEQQ